MNDFIEFVKYNNISGIPNPISPMDVITLQDLQTLVEAYEYNQPPYRGHATGGDTFLVGA